MLRKFLILSLVCLILSPALIADEISDQEYINKLHYKNNKLELVTKKRLIDEKKSYGYTDIDTTLYTQEAYTYSYSDISTSSLSQAEVKEIREWYIFKGGVRELSDLEFMELTGDKSALARIQELENERAYRRGMGNIFIGAGLLVMIGGAGFSAGQSVITAGALAMTGGFFLSAFNLSPAHYIQPDYAQEKIDEYNIALKRKLNLPLEYN